MCSGSALLGDLLRKHDFLSMLSFYPRIFLQCVYVYHLLLGIHFFKYSYYVLVVLV